MPMAGKKWTPAQRAKFKRTMKTKRLQRKAKAAINEAQSPLINFINGKSMRVAMQNSLRKTMKPPTIESLDEAISQFTPGRRNGSSHTPEDAVHYLHGELRERIRAFAERIDVPLGPLTERMGELLLGKARKIPRA